MTIKSFEDQLEELIDKWIEFGGDREAVVTALEAKLTALKEGAD